MVEQTITLVSYLVSQLGRWRTERVYHVNLHLQFSKGYCQVLLTPADWHYQYTFLAFVLYGAPATFHSLKDVVLRTPWTWALMW